MTLQTKGIGFFKNKIISYYEELTNKIDVVTEEFFSRENIQDSEVDGINARRNEWLQRIELVRKKNMFDLEKESNLDVLNMFVNDEEKLNYVLFKNGFLILTVKRKDYDVDPSFIGIQLIYKNGYMNKNLVQKYELV